MWGEGAMAPSLSLSDGFRCVPAAEATVEDSRCSFTVGEKVLGDQLVESGTWVLRGICTGVSASKVTISNVPPLIPNKIIAKELNRFDIGGS